MKKVMFVIVAAMFMAACGSQETTTATEAVDSTSVDSASVAPVSDSAASLGAATDTLF
jgi:PBP1b-binding outer membrane lipoprotein LpoB